jgi:tRNA threonylcarbamoyladenosine biosynthesis protein TsaB
VILGLDTAIEGMRAALVSPDGKVCAERIDPERMGQAERIATFMGALFQEADCGFDRLTKIVVTVGPGGFNGVRIGLAFARGLALARGVPCVGISTLEALCGESAEAAGAIITAGAATFVGAWSGHTCLLDPAAVSNQEAAFEVLAPILGHGAPIFGPNIQDARTGQFRIVSKQINAAVLARLGQDLTPEVNPPRALYLRAPYAPPP